MKQIVMMDPASLTPYENNPRDNDGAVEAVANSIREFGFQAPVIVDRGHVVIAGHTRLKAALSLGLKEVPVIVADDLTEEQARAYRLADNKTGEIATWLDSVLAEELAMIEGIDMEALGFEIDRALDEAEEAHGGAVEKRTGGSSVEIGEDYFDDLDTECPRCHFRFKAERP